MSIRTLLLASATVLAAAAAVHAQGMGPDPDPSAVKPGVYAIERSHTRVLFDLSHMGFTTWYGDFTDTSGQMTLDPAHLEATKLTVKVPVDSVTTTNAKLDGELKSADWLDTARFPVATFTSTGVTRTGPRDADVMGQLTLHGVTRPIVLHAHFNGGGNNMMSHAYTTGFEVTGEIRRSDFGVTKFVPMVGDQVKLMISAALERIPG